MTATRWSQLTLVENDPANFDLDFWLGYFQKTQSNAACISAGGYICYYPTEVPLHWRSRWLGDGDPFGDLVAGCRALDMHVMARVDPHAVHDDVKTAHPEWIACDCNGQPRRHWSYPEVWVTCALGGYNHEFMPKIVREIAASYDIDAVFANRWAGHGICYCHHCTTTFQSETGSDLPVREDPADEAWIAYVAWRRDVLTGVIRLWQRTVEEVRPHGRFIPNMGHHSIVDFDLNLVSEFAPILFVDHQARRGIQPHWSAGRNAKRMRGAMGDRPIGGLSSVGLEEAHRWKDSVQNPAEMHLWVADGLAQGLRPWFTKFNAGIHDSRWLDPVAEMFATHKRLEPHLEGTQPEAEIALIDPLTTLANYEREQRVEVEAGEQGFYHALVEAGIPFDMLSDYRLEPDWLDPYRLIVMANAAFLSNAQCEAIRAYVERGGSVVASFETSRYDDKGRKRAELGLGDVFGVSLQGDRKGPLKNLYWELDRSTPNAAFLLEGMDGAERIVAGTSWLDVAPKPDVAFESPLKLIPPFLDLPMEEVYEREPAGEPAFFMRESGHGGRIVYTPWNVGEIFWDVLNWDHGRLIAQAILWALGKEPNVRLETPGISDLAVRTSAERICLHLVNLSNPMMLKGPVRRLLPSPPQTLRVHLPTGRSVKKVRLVLADKIVDTTMDGGVLTVEVLPFEVSEVVRIDLA
ncbi:MAG: alpha-amylase family protein [Pseudomonadota bacterium]